MSKIRSEWAVSSVGCFPKHFFFYSLYWKPSYLSTLIHIITVSTRNSEQDLLPRNFLSPALLSSPKMTVCQQYLYCWENSHAAQLRSQHRREYSPTCKLLKCSPMTAQGMKVPIRNCLFRSYFQSPCVLLVKQGTAFTTDSLLHQEVTYQFPGKGLLRWWCCRQDAAPFISANPAFSWLSCSPS